MNCFEPTTQLSYSVYTYGSGTGTVSGTGTKTKEGFSTNEMKDMTTDLSKNYTTLSNNSNHISTTTNEITNPNNTGLYDLMISNPIYDFSGNSFMYHEKNPSLIDERISDDKHMIQDNGHVLFLGGLTMVTLVIFGLLIQS